MLGKRKVLENEFDLFRIFTQHLLEWRVEPRTVCSLIVPEDGHGYRRIFGAFEREPGNVDLMN